MVNYASPSLAYSGVVVDERRGGDLATTHLLALERRRLLFVGGPLFLTAVAQRWDGAKRGAAAADASIELEETRGLNIRHGREVARRIIEAGPGVYDGIVAASDLIAIGIVQVLNDVPGFAVPGDIAVTGYDNNHFASESAILISTVAQPGEEMGAMAADLLLEHIEKPTMPNRTVTLDPRVIPRASTLGAAWRRD